MIVYTWIVYIVISTFFDDNVLSFREQIEKIINPQTFRDAVRTFRLDTSLYSSEHREQIGEVLLR